MFEGITAFWKGYEADFESPYSLEMCVQMIRDQSFGDYFERHPESILNPMFVDINRVLDDEYTFTLKKRLFWGKSLSMDYTGRLTHIGDKTHVNTILGFSAGMWLLQLAYLAVIAIFIIGATAYSLRPDTPPANHWLMLPILLSLYWLMVVVPINQFIRIPHQWLSGIPETPPDQMTPSCWNVFKRKFNAYTPEDIQACRAKLDSDKDNWHYQYTPIGMLHGKTVNQTSFIAFMPESDEKTYFWMKPDNRAMRGGLSYELFGTLVTEDAGTRISGFCRAKHGEHILIYLMLFVAVLAWFYAPLALVIGTLTVLLVIAIIMGTVGQYSWYPIQKIIGEEAIPRGKLGWISLRREFNFVSPYPIEDCANMFMEYSEPTDILTTPSGDTIGNVVDEGLFIAVYPTENNQAHFWIKSQGNRFLAPVEAIGSMQTEGYGTRIIGYSHSPLGWIWILGAIGVGILLFFLLWLAPIVFGALMYGVMINRVDGVGSYPQRTLGLRAQRKRKVADIEGTGDES